MDYGSVCSGIESVSVAVDPIGWKAAWFAEIEPFPSAVLAHRFPGVDNLGDMTKIARNILEGRVHAPSILVGGTPCQAFSVAGMRAGLDDARGQLSIRFVELADAIDHVRAGRGDDECVVWWENVPGVLSDKGNAFGCFLAALVGESDALQPAGGRWTDAGCVYGPTRAAAWRVLDAQYFGLAQRRRRVFVVASARAGFDPASVLFEREGVRRDSAPSRGAREGVASCAADSAGSRGNGRDIAPTLDATMDRKWGSNQWANNGFAIIEPVIMSSGQANAEICTDGGAPVLTCLHEAPIVVHGTKDPDVRYDQAHTLGRNSGQENAVCVTGEITHALKADGFDGSEDGTGRGQPIVAAFLHMNKGRPAGRSSAHEPMVSVKDHVPTLTTDGHQQSAVSYGSAVRRLTPTECERLQGFPDNWTLIPWRNKPAEDCPDGPRYKAIGNSKAVLVVRWIAKRIDAMHQQLQHANDNNQASATKAAG